MTKQENNTKPLFTLVIFTIIWLAAVSGFIGLLILSFMVLSELRNPEVMLVWIATPIQLLAVIKSVVAINVITPARF